MFPTTSVPGTHYGFCSECAVNGKPVNVLLWDTISNYSGIQVTSIITWAGF